MQQPHAEEHDEAALQPHVLAERIEKPARVELRRYPRAHPFASLSGSDNMLSFSTSRYATNPLIVRGPGAGAEVTAGGIFADLLRLAAYLGAPS